MLGKQWLNRYASTDLRGTAIERSQNRQRKLDGIITWYFDHAMESLPLMLQIALLLLGGALSRYLWDINIIVGSVILGVTSIGIIFYLSIVVAGTGSESCPYQTPGSRFLRHIFPRILHGLRSAPFAVSAFVSSTFYSVIQSSALCRVPTSWWSAAQHYYNLGKEDIAYIIITLPVVTLTAIVFIPITLVIDAHQLGRTTLQSAVAFSKTVYHRYMGPTSKTHVLDLRCIQWVLQTSLDKKDHLSTLKYLEPLMSTPTDFDPALVAYYCFNVLVGCINAGDREVVVIHGLEQLAMASALCLFYTISHLSIMDPTSSVLKDVNQHYEMVFPADIDFCGHQFSHVMNAIHRVFIRTIDRRNFTWDGYTPPSDEHVLTARALIKLAQFGYQRTQQTKVPRMTLRFALHSLSLDPPPPTSVIADCLSIIAIDLNCDISRIGVTTPDERCAHTLQINTVLTLNQCAGRGFEPDHPETQITD